MVSGSEKLAETTSLCPTCLERVPGQYEAQDGSVYLRRSCSEHGTTSRQVWADRDHWEWAADFGPDPDPTETLTVDNDHACLAVVEVTEDCNLSCSFCFASSGPGGPERSFEEIESLLETVKRDGTPRPIQFSGGEPTIRDDLPELVERAREMGFEHIQVNTNGIVLAHEEGYAERLREAGVTAVYLQFDGLDPDTYEAIRDVDIATEKQMAIENCRDVGLSVVLVPTIVPGTNDDEMGDIVRFAIENRDIVQSVNFQPVAQFGRHEPQERRFSLDEAARRLADQMEAIDARDLLPIPCCSSYCQSATALMPTDDGDVVALTSFLDDDAFDVLSGMVEESDWMELLASTPAGQTRACTAAGCCGIEVPDGADEILESVVPVSFTGFMDADAADVGRLGNCCVSVPTPGGDLVPFCAYNMTTEDGRYAIRNRNGWGGRSAVDGPTEAAEEAAVEFDGGTEGGDVLDVDDVDFDAEFLKPDGDGGCCGDGGGCGGR